MQKPSHESQSSILELDGISPDVQALIKIATREAEAKIALTQALNTVATNQERLRLAIRDGLGFVGKEAADTKDIAISVYNQMVILSELFSRYIGLDRQELRETQNVLLDRLKEEIAQRRQASLSTVEVKAEGDVNIRDVTQEN